ncbi:MAG: RidA family protein [Epsilonproteobacteria bacterium]|nr:deaminase [Campylobacterota bacterium]NPA56663.1 RidA family protein [Campylobacterota bacterium]
MEYIKTERAPAAIGPYSQAVQVGDLLFTSGQIALTPEGGEEVLSQGIEEQTLQVLKNLQGVIEEAGGRLEGVIKTTIFLVNIEDFPRVNRVYADFFGDHRPARSTVAVKSLPKGALVEIEAIAKL